MARRHAYSGGDGMRWMIIVACLACCGVGFADELSENTNEIKTLTVEQAEALPINDGDDYISLNGLTEITPEVAEALATSGYLSLNGLTGITAEVAEVLAEGTKEKTFFQLNFTN